MTSLDINTVISEHGPSLLAYVTRLTGGDRHLAEDIVQETWLRAWKRSHCLDEDLGSVRGWLRRIAHNVAIDQHRRRRARPAEVNLPEPGLHNAAIVDDPADDVHSRLAFGTMLESLSCAQRSTVFEVYFADHTATAAATALGIPVGTVKSRIHNALNNLRTTHSAPHAA